MMNNGFTHLDAEAIFSVKGAVRRTESYDARALERKNSLLRQKSRQSFVLCSKAGRGGA